MKKIILIMISLMLLAFSGCTNTAISVDDGMTHEQQELFSGNAFVYYASATNIAVDVPQNFLGCTQNNPIEFYNFILSFSVTPFDIDFYESPTITNNGTQVYGKNRNRLYSDSHELRIYVAPTITNNGTKIFESIEYGDKKTSGILNSQSFILKPNTCYLFQITNKDAAAGNFNVNFLWIEY